MDNNNKTGWIEVVTGPMFAGKSEELIRRIKRLEFAKKNFLVFKPTLDNRYSENELVTHQRNKKKAINISHSEDLKKIDFSNIDAIIIDEVQFLDEGIVDVLDDIANKGVRVIAGGLDMDFKNKPFLNTALLLAKAEFVTKLTAICVVCGDPATRSQRIVNGLEASENDPIILLGAKESYEPRCRKCHHINKN